MTQPQPGTPPHPRPPRSGLNRNRSRTPNRRSAATLFGCLAALATASGPLARAQSDLVIDPGTLALKAGRLEFQFRSVSGSPADFEIWRSASLGPSPTANWQPATDGTVEAVAEGLFRGTLPLATLSQAFVRIRRNGLPPLAPAPLLNEVMPDNVSTLAVTTGVYWDWIELLNPHDEAVDLAGYGLTDDPTRPLAWTFPAVTLQPGQHQLIYASPDAGNAPIPTGVLRADFGLRNDGETLILSDPWGREVDRITVPALDPDQSIGRSPDGGPRWHQFSKAQATPGRENASVTDGLVVAPPEFSIEGGFYPQTVEVRLTTREPNGSVYFTTNGSLPNLASTRAAAPLTISRTTVLRAVAFDPEGHPSEAQARTYFIGVQHTLPVLSMAAPPANFEFRNGYLLGMGSQVLNSRGEVLQSYPFSGSNAWQDREVEVHLEFFDPDGRLGFRQPAGIKVYGGWGSRGYPQKSLAVFARRQYGAGRFDHSIFPDQPIDAFEAFVLRNSGNDNQSTHQIPPRPPIAEFSPTKSYGSYFVNGTFTLLRDAMMQRLLVGQTTLDLQAYRPSVLYLNGEYWGLYNLREKLNEAYVVAHHELPQGSIDLIEAYGDVRAGDATAYRAFRDYVSTRNMAVEANYQYVASRYLDPDNFIDYHLAVLYFQNFDIGNIKCWRPRTPQGRFHWMVYDQDYGFNLWPSNVYVADMARDYADYANMFDFYTAGTGTSTGWPNAGGRTLLLRRLLANPGFRDRFLRRCADLLNSAFREERVETVIDTLAAVIRPEIADHLHRWSWDELRQRGYGAPYQPEYQPFTASTWETNLHVLHDFARSRPTNLRADALHHFGLQGGLGHIQVTVEPADSGSVQLNSLALDRYPWQGTYFGDLTNRLIAVARPGFRFREWITPNGSITDPALNWRVGGNLTHSLLARFDPAPSNPPPPPSRQLQVTEINYHSPDDLDADDWIELHNTSDQPLALEGWTLRDQQDDGFCLLPAVSLEPGGYRVVARSIPKFQWAHPQGPDPIARLPFGLGNGGDTIRLFDPTGVEVARIPYGDAEPWPSAPDGGGATLELVDPNADPASPRAWRASAQRGGTPGKQ